MKRITAFITLLLLLSVELNYAYAADFSINSSGSRSDRLFTLDLYVEDSESDFCSVLFTLNYDADLIEYRKSFTSVDNATVKVSNDSSRGVLNAIFFTDSPIDCTDGAEILQIQFMPKRLGNGNFSIAVQDAIDTNAVTIDFNDSVSCEYEIVGKTADSLTVKSFKSSNFKIKTNSTVPDSDVKASDSEEENGSKRIIKINSQTENDDYLRTVLGLGAIVIILIVYYIIKYRKGKSKDEKDNNSKEPTKK